MVKVEGLVSAYRFFPGLEDLSTARFGPSLLTHRGGSRGSRTRFRGHSSRFGLVVWASANGKSAD
jgi:hypothetical protein